MRIGRTFARKRRAYLWLLFLLAGAFWLRTPSPEYETVARPVRLYLHRQDRVITLDFEDYIAGVVAAEMPATFDLEALKAQAVCARTYAYNRILTHHPYPKEADVTDDITNCQAYRSQADFIAAHPDQGEVYWRKIRQATAATAQIILLYDGAPADTVYHSTCGGQTESAADAWGKAVAYLSSVSCGYCQDSSYYERAKLFSGEALKQGLRWQETPTEITVLETTAAGNVRRIQIDGNVMNGEEFRNRLDLPSRHIRVQSVADSFIIQTRGYGHRVGMCQFGAAGMARAGFSCDEILARYYPGGKQFDAGRGSYLS
jgi:stage II sporulation protein D